MIKQLMVLIMIIGGVSLMISCESNDKPAPPLVLTESHFQSDDLAYDAYLLLLSHMDSMEGDNYESLVKQLPQHWRAVYTTFWLECEVNNGGHHQFFWNSDGEINIETLDDLKYIKADSFASIYKSALDIYDKHDYSEEKQSSGNSWEGFTEA